MQDTKREMEKEQRGAGRNSDSRKQQVDPFG